MELSLPCANSYEQSQLQPKSLYCNQSWKNSITYAKYMWKICVRIGMCYLCTIHIIDAYSSTTKKMQKICPSMYEQSRRAIYRRARRGRSSKCKGLYIGGLGEGKGFVLSFATSPPKGSHICIQTLCLFFLLPFPWRPS